MWPSELAELSRDFVLIALSVMAVAASLSGILFAVLWRRLRRLEIDPDAGFMETLRALPLSFVIALDLLDFGLDVLAAPVVWVLLDRLGLKALRNRAVVEALIPLTQALPTFSLAWIVARFLPDIEVPQ